MQLVMNVWSHQSPPAFPIPLQTALPAQVLQTSNKSTFLFIFSTSWLSFLKGCPLLSLTDLLHSSVENYLSPKDFLWGISKLWTSLLPSSPSHEYIALCESIAKSSFCAYQFL